VQLVPEIAKRAGRVSLFQRTANWSPLVPAGEGGRSWNRILFH
jgi:cation diffusion facilitator CzcD-associated flavoprotein CzcO